MSAAPTITSPHERQLLAAAREGDQDAYRRLIEPRRADLHALCYRMLGSVQDAEDALQDALLRAWRGLPRFEERASLRTWLHRIATNASLDLSARRPRRAPDRIGLGRALPGRAPRLRAARERRAGVRRRAPALATESARRAHPARGAGLLGARGGRGARHYGGLGQQRSAARAQGDRRAAAAAQSAGHRSLARRPADAGDGC